MEYGRKFWCGMEYGMEDFWYGMEMEWKKIASMEYGKIVFHLIPYHALVVAHIYPSVTGQRQTLTYRTIRTLFIALTTS